MNNYELIYVIVNEGVGSKVMQKAKKLGISGGTTFMGKGTINDSLLNFLALYEENKEIVLLAIDENRTNDILDGLNKKFKFEKPHHGIVFSTHLFRVIGSHSCINHDKTASKEEKNMYKAIFTIVNRGRAEDVVELAQNAGAKGGTIINARGSGIHETAKLFNMEIEPEKEIVLILVKEDIMENVLISISEGVEIDKPGNGIIFVQDVQKVIGIYE